MSYKANEQAVAAWLMDMEKLLAYWTGMVYDGHTSTRIEDGWRLIVRARRAVGGVAVVMFIDGINEYECYRMWAYSLTHTNGAQWKKDRYRNT